MAPATSTWAMIQPPKTSPFCIDVGRHRHDAQRGLFSAAGQDFQPFWFFA
jgi:hypothetical protein